MNIHSQILNFKTNNKIEITDITPHLVAIIGENAISNGFLIVSSRHTTTALIINEFEERLLEDIKSFFEKLVPAQQKYLHNDIHLRDCPPNEPENAHSHIIAMLLRNSEIIPIIDGRLAVGQWQSIMFAELDGPRDRTIQIQIIGETI